MKLRVVQAFLLFLLLVSCTSVRFEQPQPAGKPELSKFPRKYRGTYYCESVKDTLKIYSDSFYFSKELYSIKDESVVLKKHSKYRIISIKNDSKGNVAWEVFLTKLSGKDMLIYCIKFDGMMDQEKSIEVIASISDTQSVYFDDKKLNYLLINPTTEQLDELIEVGAFNNCLKFNRLSR